LELLHFFLFMRCILLPEHKMTSVPHSKPTTGPEEADAVARVLASGHHARGPVTREFEAALAATVGMDSAHATSSGTTALQLALLALGAGPGRSVLIPSLTCAAVWNAVRATGAETVLYDGDYGLLDAAELARVLKENTSAVVVVAPPDGEAELTREGGFAADELGLATLNGVPVVLDRCQQLAPNRAGANSGVLRARCEIFSFYATKCISTGSGGAIATNDAGLHERIVDLNSHDKRDTYATPRHNFQFDDLRAAVGVCQLKKLANFVSTRESHAAVYSSSLSSDVYSASLSKVEGGGSRRNKLGAMIFRYLYDCGPAPNALDNLEARLLDQHIEAKRPVFRPLHRYMNLSDADFPRAVQAWTRMLSLPLYPLLSETDRERVIAAIRQSKVSSRS